ncbi:leucine-rich repeat and transmembrane domain-containing protein 1 isoform X2 [Cavia porcellus]|uniref:leucine-rich repeat and transmembrane domain-containing protein 1 isoform X2 n=1 Tax=Cavia porcellus TaxID=10141 RepID=UPI000661CB5A|nr:leucine-rich repeat and transmembrane domain-containing protein 1 isoform X2 [Cavia porcellus]
MKGELLLLSSMIFLLQGACGCPEKCFCHSSSNSVDCSHRGLAEIPPNLPPETLTLLLQDNQIYQLPAFAFRTVPRLKTLNLSNNSLSELVPEAFHGLQHLEVLNVTQNSLLSLESRLFHFLPQLRELDLSSNNISHLPTSLGGITDGIVCGSPDTWKGKDLLKIPHELYQPCPPPPPPLPPPELVFSQARQHDSEQGELPKSPEDHNVGRHDISECMVKPKPRPANLRHAVATVVITGVVCGIVCLMMLAAAIYGCTYAAITAQHHGRASAQTSESGKMGGKEPFDSLPA